MITRATEIDKIMQIKLTTRVYSQALCRCATTTFTFKKYFYF